MSAVRVALFGLLLRVVYAGYCTQTYSCQKTCSSLSRYYTSCGWWGWERCTRHRTVYRSCQGTCYRSVCCTGYTGYRCNTPICFGSETCTNGGTCSAPNLCKCPRGFLEPRCYDINECTSTAHGCKHICANTHGSYQCRCRTGYTLAADLKSCLDMNECLTNNGGCNQVCNNIIGSYTCGCRNGYELSSDRRTCSDKNECTLGTSGCAHQCKNTEGSYVCSCNSGYELAIDRLNCEDKDECGDGTATCDIFCNNTPGSYTCYCADGYVISNDGNSCEDVDECATRNGNCDQLCINEAGSYRCECFDGYRTLENSNNTACIDIDECSESSAMCSQICSNTNGSYECSCNSGYLLDTDGFTCLDKNDCENISCQNGGACVDGLDFYTCDCKGGFHGQLCEIDINECNFANGGCQDICTNSEGSFICNCSVGRELLDDGYSCGGNEQYENVFERLEINRQLLPKPCFTVMLVQCTDGNDVNIYLSSTSRWYRNSEEQHIMFTLGIVYVNVNDYAIPFSLYGIEITLKDENFVIKYGVPYGHEKGNPMENDFTDDTCLPMELTEEDMFDFVSEDSFMKTYLLSLHHGLPNWLRFMKSGTEILSVQDVKTELIYGKNLDEISWCSGAPVIPEHLYNVFQFDSGFTISVMGSEVTLPRLLRSKKFCIIVDLCHSNGGTVFIMIPDESRTLLSELAIFKTLKEEQNIQILPRGIGISLANGINANSYSLSDQLWNGDHMFTPFLPGVDFWTGGSVVMNAEIFGVRGNVDMLFGVPNVETMLTSLYREEMTGLIDIQLSASIFIKFELFEEEHTVTIPLSSSVNAYISLGGSNRQWCGDVSNPPGIFLSAVITFNPFKGVPFLE